MIYELGINDLLKFKVLAIPNCAHVSSCSQTLILAFSSTPLCVISIILFVYYIVILLVRSEPRWVKLTNAHANELLLFDVVTWVNAFVNKNIYVKILCFEIYYYVITQITWIKRSKDDIPGQIKCIQFIYRSV